MTRVSPFRFTFICRTIIIFLLILIQIVIGTLIGYYLISNKYVSTPAEPLLNQRDGEHPLNQKGGESPFNQRGAEPLLNQKGDEPVLDQRGVGRLLNQRDAESLLSQTGTENKDLYIQEKKFNISSNVRIVNLTRSSKAKFDCIKTKTLLDDLSTVICLHDPEKDAYVSGTFYSSGLIWEEEQVTRILQLLIKHPNLHFIDIGANIGTYTMFVAALGRFVLAIDCFAPNLVRIRRAIQLTKTFNKIVLVQNALFTQSGQDLRLSVDPGNIGGQAISLMSDDYDDFDEDEKTFKKSSYIVKTITFDEVLPILLARGIRKAIIKIDIEGSESFAIQNGTRIFDTLHIPFVQMEWMITRLHIDRVRIILDFFAERKYDPMTDSCVLLDVNTYDEWPVEVYWLKRNVPGFC